MQKIQPLLPAVVLHLFTVSRQVAQYSAVIKFGFY